MGFFAKLFGPKKPKSTLPITNIEKRFELLGRTGQGSMSKVWRARDKTLGRTICLKILDKEKTIAFEARFPGLHKPQEGTICMALRHKNIVQTFEYGLTTTGDPYLVMELIDGLGLNYLVETNNAQLNGRRIDYLCQICDGLEHVHQQRFLHRDICPRNVMVTKEGVVKIIDFGLTIPYTPEFCRPGNRTGTSDYLAPELIKRNSTDHRVDMFALGVTAYEIFTGGLPWEKARGSMEVLQKHLNITGKDPREFVPSMEKTLASFLIRAVERNPVERFQTTAEFREALRALPKQDY